MSQGVSPQILAAFHQFDADGDGLVDPAELAAVLMKLDGSSFNAESCKTLFEAADANKDGKVDLEEFVAWIFHDPKAQQVLDALDRERMSRVGILLLTTDLPWMKESVEQPDFLRAVSRLIRQDGADDTPIFSVDADANTMAVAHALLSVQSSAVPDKAYIEATKDAKLTDASAAPLLYAALAAGCKELHVVNTEWGERTVLAFETALPSSRVEAISLSSAAIGDEEFVVRIMNSIDADTASLHTVDLSNNAVGLDGLRAVQDALQRCPSLRTVGLLNIGPWADGGGIGSRGSGSEEERSMLQAVHSILKERGGSITNEAFT